MHSDYHTNSETRNLVAQGLSNPNMNDFSGFKKLAF